MKKILERIEKNGVTEFLLESGYYGIELECSYQKELKGSYEELHKDLLELIKDFKFKEDPFKYPDYAVMMMVVSFYCEFENELDYLSQYQKLLEKYNISFDKIKNLIEYLKSVDDILWGWHHFGVDGKYWRIDFEDTIGNNGVNGIEIITPKLKYSDFIIIVPKVIELLQEIGFQSDKGCGYHIHMSVPKMQDNENFKYLNHIVNELVKNNFSDFAIAVCLTCQDLRSLYAKGDYGRVDSGKYVKTLLYEIKDALINNKNNFSDEINTVNSLIHRDITKTSLLNFLESVSKEYLSKFMKSEHHFAIRVFEDNVEVRGFGGVKGFVLLKNSLDIYEIINAACKQVSYLFERTMFTNDEVININKEFIYCELNALLSQLNLNIK